MEHNYSPGQLLLVHLPDVGRPVPLSVNGALNKYTLLRINLDFPLLLTTVFLDLEYSFSLSFRYLRGKTLTVLLCLIISFLTLGIFMG